LQDYWESECQRGGIRGRELDLSGSEHGQLRAFVNMVIKLSVAQNAEEGCCSMEINLAQHDTGM
jgi:hypothetical protein